MKRLFAVSVCIILLIGLVVGCATSDKTPEQDKTPNPPPADSTPEPDANADASGTAEGLKDGTYTAESTKTDTGWYTAKVTIKDGKYTDMEFIKYDAKGEKVDLSQYKHPPGIEAMEKYPKEFIEKQDASKVDVVSGATGTYSSFKELIGQIRAQAPK